MWTPQQPIVKRHAISPGPAGALFLVPLLVAVASTVHAADAVEIGSRRELFVDHFLIDKISGASLRLQPPRSAGIALKYDRPWEVPFAFYTTVLKDRDTYRMYYRGGINPYRYTCYAESSDGIRWTKPKLRLVEIDGSKKNNVILATGHQFCPFIDHRPDVPAAERYKANSVEDRPPHSLVGWVSADGIHWNRIREKPTVPVELRNNFDSQNAMFWSPVEQCYVLYARHSQEGRRATARSTSKDFLNWTEQTLMTYGDTGTTKPSQHLYTNQTHPYFRAPHIYISLSGRFQSGRRVLTDEQAEALDIDPSTWQVEDSSDGVLLTSRAGSTRYDFTFCESFVRPGIGLNNWVSRTNYPALGVVQTGPHEMSLFVQRNFGQKTACLQRMTLRLDGFSAVHAPYQGGELLTKPLTFTGQKLEINFSTSAAGMIRAEIQDAMGRPLPGYNLDECARIIGDEIQRIVVWKHGSDVSLLAGKPVRLRFVMKDADLFSIRFRPG